MTPFCVLRDGSLEKLWKGVGNFRAAGIFFFVIKFLVRSFLGHSMNIFLGLIGVNDFFFHLIFPRANIFFGPRSRVFIQVYTSFIARLLHI